MPKRSRSQDLNQLAASIVSEATKEKNPHAVALGRLGGIKGGRARAKKLSAQARKNIAIMAARARWKNRGLS